MGRGLCEWRRQPRRPRTAPDRGLLGTQGCPTAPSKDAALPACLLFFSQMPSSESAAPLPPQPGLHASDPAQVPRGHSQEGGGQLPAPSTLPPRWLRGCPRHLPARSLLTQPGAPRFSPHPSDRGPRAWRVLCSCLPIRSQSAVAHSTPWSCSCPPCTPSPVMEPLRLFPLLFSPRSIWLVSHCAHLRQDTPTLTVPWLIHVDAWQKPTQYCEGLSFN